MAAQKTGVLLVDDEETDLVAIARPLQNSGRFRIFSASDFNEAVAVYEQHADEIELAILDIALAGRNGVDLAKHLLASKPHLSVLFVSGHVGASVIRFYGINASDEHFLQKPFDEATLLRRVEQAMASPEPLQRVLSARDASTAEE